MASLEEESDKRYAIPASPSPRVSRSIPAKSEIRSCGWLAQVDEYGGSIFHFRPHSNGAQDMKALVQEVITLFDNGPQVAHPETPRVAA